MKFSVSRKATAGVVMGGHVIGDLAFEVEFAVAGIRLQLGSEVCWLTRDEAHEVAIAIIEASIDA